MKNTCTGRVVRAQLARISVGRMFLHVACALRDGRVQWHWQGIKRELTLPVEIIRHENASDLEKN